MSLFASLYDVCYAGGMNDVQTRISVLQGRGWTLVGIAKELDVTANAVQKWKYGERNARPLLETLDRLGRRRSVPKNRRDQRTRKGRAL